MPRLGQLLSALLIALIGVLVVQMFLIAGMQQRLEVAAPTPDAYASGVVSAAPDPFPGAEGTAFVATAGPTAPAQTLIIVITTGEPFAMTTLPLIPEIDSSPVVEMVPSASDGGRARIERFIALTGAPLGATRPEQDRKDTP